MPRDLSEKCRLLRLPEGLFALASLTLLLVPSIPPFRQLQSVSTWIKPYYYANYFDLGFIKRGFIGTMYRILGVPSWADRADVIVVGSHVLVSIALAALFWIFARQQMRGWALADRLVLYTFFLLSPAFFVRLGFDTGRMDLWCLAISVATLMWVVRSEVSAWGASLVSGASIAVQMLIHDASVLFYSPLIFAALQHRSDFSSSAIQLRLARSIPAIIPPLLTGAALLAWGRYEPGQAALDTALIRLHPDLAGGMPMELTWTLSRTIKMVLAGRTPWNFFGGHVLIVSYFFLSLALVILVTKAPWWMYASALSPLIVSLLATDSVRFLGISVVSLFLLVVVVARDDDHFKLSRKLSVGLYALAAFFFVFGPWGCCSVDPLPLLRYVPWRI